MVAVDLFCGCGGLSLGLIKANINVVAAMDNWKPAIDVYRANFKHPVLMVDLSQIDSSIAQINKYLPDLIAGGPPCQDFSSAGKRNENGDKADLTLSFSEIVVGVSPQWFLMENVDRINKSNKYKQAKEQFKRAGYGLTEMVIDASLCNVPQKRKRMFLIGKLNEQDNFLKPYLLASLSTQSMTVKEYLGNELNTEYYYRHARSYNRRAIFSIDESSATIRGVNRPIPPKYKLHPGDATTNLEKVRPLTTQERALIQTFPKNFQWPLINKSIQEQLIGNAVPVNLGRYVGQILLAYHNDLEKYMVREDYDLVSPGWDTSSKRMEIIA